MLEWTMNQVGDMVKWWAVRYQTGGLMLLASLLLITPLCGLMFDCGCTWPWEGLDSHCNIHDSTALQQCPWCVSMFAGVVSVALAVICGVLLSMLGRNTTNEGHYALALDVGKRISRGLFGFTVVALLTGYLSGYFQAYPYFILLHAWP